MTRIQRERFSDPLEYERIKNAYILHNEMINEYQRKLQGAASAAQGKRD
jgi:aspartate carbamoyltransferase catalytic subunit